MPSGKIILTSLNCEFVNSEIIPVKKLKYLKTPINKRFRITPEYINDLLLFLK